MTEFGWIFDQRCLIIQLDLLKRNTAAFWQALVFFWAKHLNQNQNLDLNLYQRSAFRIKRVYFGAVSVIFSVSQAPSYIHHCLRFAALKYYLILWVDKIKRTDIYLTLLHYFCVLLLEPEMTAALMCFKDECFMLIKGSLPGNPLNHTEPLAEHIWFSLKFPLDWKKGRVLLRFFSLLSGLQTLINKCQTPGKIEGCVTEGNRPQHNVRKCVKQQLEVSQIEAPSSAGRVLLLCITSSYFVCLVPSLFWV